jgi:hypothetical protein
MGRWSFRFTSSGRDRNPRLDDCQNNRLNWSNGLFRIHSGVIVRSATLSRTGDKKTIEDALGETPEPADLLGREVRTPNGRGTLAALSQRPGGWRVRVSLDGERYWDGPAFLASTAEPLSAKDERPVSRQKAKP